FFKQKTAYEIFGGNSLGVADAWNQVRIGGALGGDSPAEALRKGSIAIFSNSGNFTTTIATYLRMAGLGNATSISSGKDVYIHFAAPEWAFALANDARTKGAVMYVEPGGYYEYDAEYTKPIVACVVGRWKSKLTRAVGHAGAMSGGSDDAAGKERWFMDKFGVDAIFTPEKPVFSAKGAVVTNIAHISAALSAVMRENATRPDFAPEGSLPRRNDSARAGYARSEQGAKQRACRRSKHCGPPPPRGGRQGATRADRAVCKGRIAGREGGNLRSLQGDAGRARVVRHRGAGSESGGDAGGLEDARREIGVRALSANPRRPSDSGDGARGHRGDPRMGASDAQAHLQTDRGKPAVVAAPVRDDDWCFGRRRQAHG